jgi:hypothetical protein
MTKTTFEQPEPDDRGSFDSEPWETTGIPGRDGMRWSQHRIEPAEAVRWRHAGVSDPIDAVRWKIAGVSPDTVREWIYAKIDAREAVGWTELGFTVVQARKHKRAGRTPVQAYGHEHRTQAPGGQPRPQAFTWQQRALPGAAPPSARAIPRGPYRYGAPHRFLEAVQRHEPKLIESYVHRQWFDDEAIAWAVHGIEASEALAWKELGITPVEAERQQAQGISAMQAVKAWWQAGIPFDEVADWIGAGLTPSEAAQQRAKGVTAERAAVLRSLQKDQ